MGWDTVLQLPAANDPAVEAVTHSVLVHVDKHDVMVQQLSKCVEEESVHICVGLWHILTIVIWEGGVIDMWFGPQPPLQELYTRQSEMSEAMEKQCHSEPEICIITSATLLHLSQI